VPSSVHAASNWTCLTTALIFELYYSQGLQRLEKRCLQRELVVHPMGVMAGMSTEIGIYEQTGVP
jgi:hypothetical protein